MSFDWTDFLRKSKPIVVAFNGYAVGGGLTFFLAADVLVASETASFHLMFTKLGAVAEMCSTKYLPARVGFGRASELLLTGRSIKADEAFSIGLVDHLVPAAELRHRAMGIANSIAANPRTMTMMTMMTKELLDQNYLEQVTDKVWRRESDALSKCWASAEHLEALNAFVEKRPPDFDKFRRGK